MSSFGLNSLQNGFVALSLPPRDAFPTLREVFLNARVMSCGTSDHPDFPPAFDPVLIKGKRLTEFVGIVPERFLEQLISVVRSPPPVSGRPWIRRSRFHKEGISPFNRLEEALIEETMFMDPDTNCPKWVCGTVVSRIRSVRIGAVPFFFVQLQTVTSRCRSLPNMQTPCPLQSSSLSWSAPITRRFLFWDPRRIPTRAISWKRHRSASGWAAAARCCFSIAPRC